MMSFSFENNHSERFFVYCAMFIISIHYETNKEAIRLTSNKCFRHADIRPCTKMKVIPFARCNMSLGRQNNLFGIPSLMQSMVCLTIDRPSRSLLGNMMAAYADIDTVNKTVLS